MKPHNLSVESVNLRVIRVTIPNLILTILNRLC